MSIRCIAEILDVIEDDICWLSFILMILTATARSNMGRYASIYYNVLLTGMFGDWETSQDHKAMTLMKFFGDVT